MRAMRLQALPLASALFLVLAAIAALLLLTQSVVAGDGLDARIQIAADGVSEVGST